jgi:hypothetical protein
MVASNPPAGALRLWVRLEAGKGVLEMKMAEQATTFPVVKIMKNG